ncbi:MAG: NHLP bacteriocin system secretion protein [Phycisphaeraceae bacterium]|nr:NHLP bacteriocin system secretion protein [Phycisphaeraceae bacterium]
MSLSKQLFRESALERLSSPEQLDQLLTVTSPKGWIALIALWSVLAAIVVWAVVGRVPTTEQGRGILVVGGGMRQVQAPAAGRLREVQVEIGQSVAADQVVAVIDRQDLLDQIENAKRELEKLLEQDVQEAELDRRDEELQANLARVENERLDRQIQFCTEKIERLRARREVVARLVSEGNMTPIDREKIEEEIEQAQAEIRQASLQKDQIAARRDVARFERERRRTERRMKISGLESTIGMLEARHERESRVRAPFAGRVVEVRAAEQTTVGTGDPILLLEPANAQQAELEAVVFVSAATGKRLERGMSVDLSPSTVKQEEYGSLVGRVKSVADVPTSRQAMMAVLADSDLVERFTREIGLPLQVIVELERDPATLSGYRWTSSQGPPLRISPGTLCHASVNVKEQAPIWMVIPMMKRTMGGAEQ